MGQYSSTVPSLFSCGCGFQFSERHAKFAGHIRGSHGAVNVVGCEAEVADPLAYEEVQVSAKVATELAVLSAKFVMEKLNSILPSGLDGQDAMKGF